MPRRRRHERGGGRFDNAEYINPFYIVSLNPIVATLQSNHQTHQVFPASFRER